MLFRRLFQRFVLPFFTRRFLKFAIVGASGVLVNLGCLALLRALSVQINLASAIAIELSLLSNFAVNYLWTFRDVSGGWLRQALRFHLVCLGGAVFQFSSFVIMNVVWMLLLWSGDARTEYFAGADTMFERWLWRPLMSPPEVGAWVFLSQLIGIGCGMVWNYLLNFYWTWSVHKRAEPGGEHVS
ncbi:GtrA family protein [Haliangium ochraceum DSM 14365]|uniref:GtrA family protein n=1 Tax=Haliangium ochraceum (strain DSM 14365 / JCM 11303 / SMP-2) TaxID=502025 RepID=D0LK28_HALO1|nr:GtrA family protein [Haliangium ochraceum DSM 14365]